MTKDELIKKETAPRKITLWGDVYEENFEPQICDVELGDGKQLVYLGTLSQRPYWWLIFIDSKTDVNSDDFDFEEILQPLEECFGKLDDDDWNEYPKIGWDGGHWGSIAIVD